MKRARSVWTAASCVAAMVCFSSCASESRRSTGDGGREPVIPAISGEPARVTVTSVDIEPGPTTGKAILTVQAVPPASGWTVEIRPLAASTAETVEFEVVGRGPAGTSRKRGGPQKLSTEIDIGSTVKHVVVYDEDDATVLEAP